MPVCLSFNVLCCGQCWLCVAFCTDANRGSHISSSALCWGKIGALVAKRWGYKVDAPLSQLSSEHTPRERGGRAELGKITRVSFQHASFDVVRDKHTRRISRRELPWLTRYGLSERVVCLWREPRKSTRAATARLCTDAFEYMIYAT